MPDRGFSRKPPDARSAKAALADAMHPVMMKRDRQGRPPGSSRDGQERGRRRSDGLSAAARAATGSNPTEVEFRTDHRRSAFALIAVLVATLRPGESAGQRLRLWGPGRPSATSPSEQGAIIPASQEAESLMGRAREAIQREDWKLAVDSLQRIVDLPGEHVLQAGAGRYESARMQAHRQIAALPVAGLQAYRTLNDGEAAALLEKARRQHDEALLRNIVDRLLLTGSGDDASVTLAEWLMDEGRFSEAASLLRRVRLIYPDSDLPAWLVPCRLSACFAAMGQCQRAEEMLREAAVADAASTPPEETVRQIQLYIARRNERRPPEIASSWPMTGGNLLRNGRQHPVEPSLVDQHCSIFPLPVPEPREGFATIDQAAVRTRFVPGRQMVTNGDLLITKAAREVIAIDPDSLTEVWRSEPPPDFGEPVAGDQETEQIVVLPAGSSELRSPQAVLAMSTSANADVVIADDTVVTITYPESAFPQLPSLQTSTSGELLLLRRFGPSRSWPNRVTACSIKDGSLLWQSDIGGLTGATTAPAGETVCQFLAAPIPSCGVLVAPCQVNNDLYLVALDPTSGKRAWHVYVCGTGPQGPANAFSTLPLTIADHVAFVVTGQGVVVAMDIAGRSVLWTVRYPQAELHEPPWTSEPPVAVGDVLLVAPPDAGHLLCLDRATGDIRWQVERGDGIQLLGADGTHAWIVSSDLRMIDALTGKPVWTRSCRPLTGRGTLAGDRLYLPTIEGLIAVDAATGEPVPLAENQGPLVASVFAWNGALYTVGISEIRRYPDLVNGYRQAVARHQADPTNPSTAIRLARLELLRGRPAEALAVLDHLRDDSATRDPRRHGQLTHLRVRSLMAMASDRQITAEQAFAHLQRAQAIAESAEDRIETALALGDHFDRRHQPLEACIQYLSLAISAAGDEMVSLERGFQQRALLLADRRIAEVSARLSAGDRKKLHEFSLARLSEADARRDSERLMRFSQIAALGDTASQAQLRLAAWAAEALQIEQAESLLRQVLAHGGTPRLLAEAAARLAAIQLLPGELHQPASAVDLLEHLEQRWANVELPSEALLDPLEASSTERGRASGMISGAAAASDLRRRIDKSALDRHQARMKPVFLGAPQEAQAIAGEDERPLVTRNEPNEAARTVLLWLAENKRLDARRIEDQAMVWQADLRLADQPAVEVAAKNTPSRSSAMIRMLGDELLTDWVGPVASGAVEGQTLILNSPFGLHAVGLLTGRRLWSRPFEPPYAAETSTSDLWVWVHDGYLISLDGGGRLEVARAPAGNRILWSRAMPQRQWRIARARGDYVVVADKNLEKVDVFRLADGRRVGQCQFSQSKIAADKINLLLFDEVICGPVSDNEVGAFELSAPGTERWRATTTEPLSQIFKPAPDLAAIADRAGSLQIRESSTGNGRRAAMFCGCPQGAIDGAMIDGVLYVIGYEDRPRAAAAPQPLTPWQYCLAAVRIEDGKILWQRDSVWPGTYLTGEVLRMSSNAIPLAAVVRRPPATSTGQGAAETSPAERGRATPMIELTLVDKATGKDIGQRVAAPLPAGTRSASILDLVVRPGEVIVRTGPHTLRFSVEGPDGPISTAEGHR